MKSGILALLFLILISGCALKHKNTVVPAIVPQSQKTPQIKYIKPNNIIGEVEPIYILPMKSAFLARVDTMLKT